MAKIRVGSDFGSTTRFTATLNSDSKMTIEIGDAHDGAVREIAIMERFFTDLRCDIAELRHQISEFDCKAQVSSREKAEIIKEASKILEAAQKLVVERKWYSVSLKGLLGAAKAVGMLGAPIVAVATKIYESISSLG